MTMIDSKSQRQYQQASAAITAAQEKHAGAAIIHSAYNGHYTERGKHVETIIVYVYVVDHVTEMRFTPSDQLAERLPAIIDNVVDALVQVKEAV